ncbi:phospholipase [uncultured Jatrophihabitans sp.]|uniref:phospholipase n=1 Tax=uncultured Jatrophihabitans sp. TaxID=1610747 RepID=UPI0035CBF89F
MTEQDTGARTDHGTVVLDIGGDVGALILLTPEALAGEEIEISPLSDGALDVFQRDHPHEHPDGDGGHAHHHPGRTHVAVLARRMPSGIRYAAVYPGLAAGTYQLWNVDGTEADVVRVTGGEVTQLDWR